VKKKRARQLAAIAQQSRNQYMQQFIGRTVDVLWETSKEIPQSESRLESQGEGKMAANGDSQRRYIGYTPNYLRVCSNLISPEKQGAAPIDTRRSLENLITPARIDNIATDDNQSNKATWFSASVSAITDIQQGLVFG